MALSGYVYVLTQINTGKKYVGRTANPKRRKADHMRALRGGYHNNKEMQSDFNKYHGDYSFEVVGYDKNGEDKRIWSLEKQTMIRLKTYDSHYGYNAHDVAIVGWLRKCRMYSASAS